MRKIICMLLALVLVAAMLPVGTKVQAAENKLVAITFDDGPGDYTSDLIDRLNELGAKATFFVLGQNVSDYPDTIRKAYLSGHQIGCHSWSHPELQSKSEEEVLWQFHHSYDAMDEILGEGTRYINRAPYDSQGPRERSLIETPFIYWAVDPRDWASENRGHSDKVSYNIVSHTDPGDIILVHDIYESSVEGALDAIQKLQKEGFEFVTVNELFRRSGADLENHHEYGRCPVTGVDYGPVPAPWISYRQVVGGIEVTIHNNSDADIYYTIDGSEVMGDSYRYEEPFIVSNGTEVCAVAAYELNGDRSETVRKTIRQFSDISEDDWFVRDFRRAADWGIVEGYGNGYFSPRENVTRGQFAAMVYRGYGCPEVPVEMWKHQFKDVAPGTYYEHCIQWCYAKGLIEGFNEDIFAPDQLINREEIAVILDRYLDFVYASLPDGDGTIDAYSDADLVHPYARHAVDSMLKAGLIEGTESGHLKPRSYASRAEAISMLMRTLDYVYDSWQ